MSPSDRLGASVPAERTVAGHVQPPAAGDDVSGVVSALERLADANTLSPDQIRAVVSAATRLYGAASAAAGHELPPVGSEVSTTDAVMLACALVRSQDLTPFEMAVWFSRGQRA